MFGFCVECREMVRYTIKTIEGTSEVKGEEVKYNKKIATCDSCGARIFVDDIVDENLVEIDRVYRSNKGLITIEEI